MAEFGNALASHRRFDARLGCDVVKILPNEYFITREDIILSTVLGSCVAACIRDPAARVGGMNHFMLPGSDASSPFEASMRYGAYAMEMLINELLKAGARRERLEAKVFGGAAVVDQIRLMNIGQRNAEFVLNYLHTEGIPVLAQDLCGSFARHIHYRPYDGTVRVRRMRSERSTGVLTRRETELQQKLRESRPTPVFELFDAADT